MLTQKQQQRLIGALLLVFFIAVLAYFVLSKVSQNESERQNIDEEPIPFSSIIEPYQDDNIDADGLELANQETLSDQEVFVEINPPAIAVPDNKSQSRQQVNSSPDSSPSEAEPAVSDSSPSVSNEVASPATTVAKEEPARETASPSSTLPEKSSTQSAAAQQWVLQLGSFTVEENANSLKKQLEELGYQPMIERTNTNSKIIYRVRLQPDTDRTALEKQASAISTQLKINTQIFSYP